MLVVCDVKVKSGVRQPVLSFVDQNENILGFLCMVFVCICSELYCNIRNIFVVLAALHLLASLAIQEIIYVFFTYLGWLQQQNTIRVSCMYNVL